MTNAIKLSQKTDSIPALIRNLRPGEILRIPHSQRTQAGVIAAAHNARKDTGKNYTVRNLPTLHVSDVTCY